MGKTEKFSINVSNLYVCSLNYVVFCGHVLTVAHKMLSPNLLESYYYYFLMTLDGFLNSALCCQQSCCHFDFGSLSYLCIINTLVLKTFMGSDKKNRHKGPRKVRESNLKFK